MTFFITSGGMVNFPFYSRHWKPACYLTGHKPVAYHMFAVNNGFLEIVT